MSIVSKRLTAATFRQKNHGASQWTLNNFYNETGIQYDANGNITALLRNEEKNNTAVQIDQLAYFYNGNRLRAVTDNAPTSHKAAGFNDLNTAGDDYTYNENGFVKTDKNKNISNISYNRLDLPERIDFNNQTSIRYVYAASGAMLTVSYHNNVGAATKTIQYVGELVFENDTLVYINHELGRFVAGNTNKYQYYLTDHLGSTRVVLQECPASFTCMATFETAALEEEAAQFLNYEQATRIAATIFDHTDSLESQYSIRLSGKGRESMGPAKSISVMTGDTVRMEVYAKYVGTEQLKKSPALWGVALQTALPGASAIEGVTGTAASTQATNQSFASLLGGKENKDGAPPAYLNFLFFDTEMNFRYGGFVQLSKAALEDGSDIPHEKLSREVVVEEPGYLYIYLSNDSPDGGEAFFDDFTLCISESPIIQTIDYYPYGLLAKNWQRLGEKATNELFQGKTYDELTGWYDFHARQYDAALGRWFGVDPQDQFASPYLAMGNNPVMMVDPDGEFVFTALSLIIPGAQVFLPWAIGADIGMWSGGSMANGTANPLKWDYSSGRTWGYMFAGALVGGLAGGTSSAVATSGMPFANTAAMMTGSAINSIGTHVYTGGQTDISLNFGVGSYNFTQNKWGYLGKKGNRWYENVGFGLGAIGNFSDISRGFRNDAVQLQTENTPGMYDSGKDKIGHSQLLDMDGTSLVDFGPGGDFFKFDKGVNNWIDHASDGRLSQTIDIPGNIYTNPQVIRGVNINVIQKFSNRLNSKSGFYNFALRSCSTQAARGLTLGGVPVFGAHPYLLRFQIASGLRPYMFNYTYIR